jgi:SAM-dependent methyltransferase
MSLRFHEICETNHRILNPFTAGQVALLGEICKLQPEQRMLDLACGKAELLCQWVRDYGIRAVGVDLSPAFLAVARERAAEFGVQERITLVEGDAGQYAIELEAFDVISCIGATWIGGGLMGTLGLMRPGLRNNASLLLVGEPYWAEEPPDEAVEWLVDGNREVFAGLAETVAHMESAGLELIEMSLADHYAWDRYEAMRWSALADWLRENPEDPDAAEFRQLLADAKRNYLTYGRRYFGWGVFVLRQTEI